MLSERLEDEEDEPDLLLLNDDASDDAIRRFDSFTDDTTERSVGPAGWSSGAGYDLLKVLA